MIDGVAVAVMGLATAVMVADMVAVAIKATMATAGEAVATVEMMGALDAVTMATEVAGAVTMVDTLATVMTAEAPPGARGKLASFTSILCDTTPS